MKDRFISLKETFTNIFLKGLHNNQQEKEEAESICYCCKQEMGENTEEEPGIYIHIKDELVLSGHMECLVSLFKLVCDEKSKKK